MDWRAFWNGDHAIYVSATHRAVHADIVATGLIANLPPDARRVLDWGCGEAEGARAVARHCDTLFLYDSAPRVRENLRARYADSPAIIIVDDERLCDVPDGALDCAAIVSVAQYLSRDTFTEMVALLRTKLAQRGVLIVADVIPPDLSPVADARALLGLAWRNGFLLAAILGLVRTMFSDYRRLRSALGLTRWSEADMLATLQARGFSAHRAPSNVGHNQARMTFIGERT